MSAYTLHSNDVGASVTFTIEPKSRPDPRSPVCSRHRPLAHMEPRDPARAPLCTALAQALATEDIVLNSVDLTNRSIRLRYTNTRYRVQARAIGRVARILTQALPPSVEVFMLEPMACGIPLSATTLCCRDIEAPENAPDAAWTRYTPVQFADAAPQDGLVDLPPSFRWGIAPFTELALFDGDGPVQADSGIEASARYRIRPNLVLEGALRQRLYGNCEGGAVSVSALPAVRRTNAQFRATDLIEVDYLTLTHHGRPGADLYSRVSAGYLERMYGGIPAELLRKSVASRLALGAEVNFVAQRDVDLGFGFQDDPALTNILTGHISSYYDFQNGVRRRWMWAAIWTATTAPPSRWIARSTTAGRSACISP